MFFRATEDGIELFVRLTPRGGSDRIDGIGRTADGAEHLAVRVRAVAEKGAANAALETLLAKRLGLPKRAVRVVAGQTARLKTIRLEGEAGGLARQLAELAPEPIGAAGKRR
jgi:uncharacterized protein YggU (UPF0235/DUF167 family)